MDVVGVVAPTGKPAGGEEDSPDALALPGDAAIHL